jgi:hypothetical protein
MRHNQQSNLVLDRERREVLQQWEDWLETPMLVLSFAWLGLFIFELVWGLQFFIRSDWDYDLDRLYHRFWHQISAQSSQTFLSQT